MSIENCSNCGCFHDTQFGCGRKENVVEYEGKKYREVWRRAKKGELVKVVHATPTLAIKEIGRICEVTETDGDTCSGMVVEHCVVDNFYALYHDQYVVLEPIADPNDRLLSTVANLATRLTHLERTVLDVQTNVQTFAEQTETNTAAIDEVLSRLGHVEADVDDRLVSPFMHLQMTILQSAIPFDIRIHLIAELERKQTALIDLIARGDA